ncbi:MAG: hypothetical protein IAE85_02605 [Anaerolinea sp.]|nr:hypothetical protein [Anaerolinea sp.]
MLARFRWLSLFLAVTFGLLALLAVGCTPASSPIRARLTLAGEPAIGKPVVFTLDITSSEPITDVKANIMLPAGVETLSGATEWTIPSVEVGQHYVFSTTAQVVENGYYVIYSGGYKESYYQGQLTTRHGGGDSFHIIVEGDDTWVSKSPPENTWKSASSLGAYPEKPELVDTELKLSGPLTADGLTEVTYAVAPHIDLTNVEVGFGGFNGGLSTGNPRISANGENIMSFFSIPEEAQAFDRSMRWVGTLSEGQTYTFRITLDVADNGSNQLYAWVNERDPTDGHTVVGKLDMLDLQFYIPRWAR